MENKVYRYIVNSIGILIGFISLFPLVWMITSGFKTENEVLSLPFKLFPDHWVIESYKAIFSDQAFLRSIGTTFLGAIISASCCLFVNSMAAFAFARMDFPLKGFLWVYVIMTMFIPGIAILVPSFVVVQKLGMLDTLGVLIIPGVAQASWVFFIRQFYLGIPKAIEEAAMIDGANRMKTYLNIFIPLSKGPFVIVGIGAFMGYWNAFVWPVMTISNEKWFQVMQLLAFFRSAHTTEWSLLMAGSSIAALPPILLFMIFQKQIIQGIKISGLK